MNILKGCQSFRGLPGALFAQRNDEDVVENEYCAARARAIWAASDSQLLPHHMLAQTFVKRTELLTFFCWFMQIIWRPCWIGSGADKNIHWLFPGVLKLLAQREKRRTFMGFTANFEDFVQFVQIRYITTTPRFILEVCYSSFCVFKSHLAVAAIL